MKIDSRIYGKTPKSQISQLSSGTGTAVANADFASVFKASSANATSRAMASNAANPVDFTHMTRQGLADWMNEKIRNGEMSLYDSSAFLGMTVKIPVSAGPGTSISLDDQEHVDFLQKAQEGIVWAQQNSDKTTLNMLTKALDIMNSYQWSGK